MNHIDEHTIEMYVLGSELVTERRGEIEAHFKECHGCRTLAEQMEEFYQKAEEGLEEVNLERAKSKALVRLRAGLPTMQEPYGFPAHYQPNTPLAKVFYFIRRHPVVVGASGFAMIAAVGWFLNDFIKSDSKENIITDKNPSYAHLNTNSAIIEIYNQENQLLWGLPSKFIYQLTPKEFEKTGQKVVITDIDRDRKNDILTILPLGDKSESTVPLTIFSSEGKLIREISFNENIQFYSTKYDGRLSCQSFICDNFDKSGRKEIFVVTNSGRSPNIINRLSNDGTILGQYFHFGTGNIQSVQIGQDRKIVFLGQNDVGEPDSLSYAVMCVLDPIKIIGKTEASESRGFSLPLSSAEMYVIRFPLSDMNIIWNTHAYVHNLKESEINNKNTYTLWVGGTYGASGLGTGGNPTFEYIFDENFKIIDVKYDSETLRLRQEYMNQGKLHGTFDHAYIEHLKNGVRYWDGKEWQKEPTTVKH
jgi:hypothetical protein